MLDIVQQHNIQKKAILWPFLFYYLYTMKKRQLKNNVLQVFCENLQQQLQALVLYPNYLFEIKGQNGTTFLYFKIK